MATEIFINISIILGIAIGISLLIQFLKQPLIISYIITGIICGPLFLNLINSEQNFFMIFSEFGVILLLFLVGLSLDIDYLRKIGKIAVITGIGQIIFTSIIGFLLLLGLGFEKTPALYLAIAVTFSSTIIIMKLLSDKKELRSVHGRYTIGLMLVQDIIAILIMIFLPAFQSGQSLLVASVWLFSKAILVLSVVYFLSKLFLPVVLRRAASSGEFLLIFTLAWCFSIAGLGEWAGLSLEVGAIIAGLSLGSSIFKEEIISRIKPLRDFFIALFFIILGSEMYVGEVASLIIPGLILSLFILIGNPLILYFLFRRMKFTRRNSFLAGLTAAQVSEFGFVFLFLCQKLGYINGEILSIFTIVALVTIFVSSYLITYNSQIYEKFKPFLRLIGKDIYLNPEEISKKYDVLVFGYHRVGWKVCETLKEMKVPFAVIDFDPLAFEKFKERGIPFFFGDATDAEFINELPISNAKLIISTLPDADNQVMLIKRAKKINKKAIVIANLAHIKFLDQVYEAGADYVMMPHLIGGQWLSHILKSEAWNKRTFNKYRKKQKKDMKLRFTLGRS